MFYSNTLADQIFDYMPKVCRPYEEVQPWDFYRTLFPDDNLQTEENERGKYCGILYTFDKDSKKCRSIKRINDDLNTICEANDCPDDTVFAYTSPASYCGKNATKNNLRELYAITIDVDYVDFDGFCRLERSWESGLIPKPSYIVCSGSGLHLYYMLEEPLHMYPEQMKSASKYKIALTRMVWNIAVDKSEKVQILPLTQMYRVVGTMTKGGGLCRAFRVEDGEKLSVEYLNKFVSEKEQISEIKKSRFSMEEAKEKFPEWYERRIINKEKRREGKKANIGFFTGLVDRCEEVQVGHRYNYMFCLVVVAMKCGLEDVKELENVLRHVMMVMNRLTPGDDPNKLTEKNLQDALSVFGKREYIFMRADTITQMTGLAFKKRKKNGRTLQEHLSWCGKRAHETGKDGSRKNDVENYCKEHPGCTATEAAKALGCSLKTAAKWMGSYKKALRKKTPLKQKEKWSTYKQYCKNCKCTEKADTRKSQIIRGGKCFDVIEWVCSVCGEVLHRSEKRNRSREYALRKKGFELRILTEKEKAECKMAHIAEYLTNKRSLLDRTIFGKGRKWAVIG